MIFINQSAESLLNHNKIRDEYIFTEDNLPVNRHLLFYKEEMLNVIEKTDNQRLFLEQQNKFISCLIRLYSKFCGIIWLKIPTKALFWESETIYQFFCREWSNTLIRPCGKESMPSIHRKKYSKQQIFNYRQLWQIVQKKHLWIFFFGRVLTQAIILDILFK